MIITIIGTVDEVPRCWGVRRKCTILCLLFIFTRVIESGVHVEFHASAPFCLIHIHACDWIRCPRQIARKCAILCLLFICTRVIESGAHVESHGSAPFCLLFIFALVIESDDTLAVHQ